MLEWVRMEAHKVFFFVSVQTETFKNPALCHRIIGSYYSNDGSSTSLIDIKSFVITIQIAVDDSEVASLVI